MNSARVLKLDTIYQIKLMMEFPQEKFLKKISSKDYEKMKNGELIDKQKLLPQNSFHDLFEQAFGNHLCRRDYSVIININTNLFYVLQFEKPSSVDEFLDSLFEKDNFCVQTLIKLALMYHLDMSAIMPLFYPALSWYQEYVSGETFSKSLLEDMSLFRNELDAMTIEDCFEETKYWRMTNFRIRPDRKYAEAYLAKTSSL